MTDPPTHADLREKPTGWEELAAPDPHQDLATLVGALASRIDELTDRAVARITENVDEYSRVDPDHHGDLWWSTKRNLQAILVCLAQQRPFTDAELSVRRTVGARAVDNDMPIAAVMRGFRLGYVELWETAIATAEDLGTEASSALLANASLMWVSLDQVSSAITQAYRHALQARQLQARRKALGFVADLRELPTSTPDAERLAHELDLDPTGSFLWAAFRGHTDDLDRAAALVVDTAEGSLALLAGPDLAAADEPTFAARLSQRGARNVGVGTARIGLRGAARSLVDAERAHQTATILSDDIVRFRDQWLACLLLDAADDLTEILAPVLDALQDEELAETLTAYLDADGTLADAGSALAVHPNTVAYRLRCLADRVGLNARTSRGIVEATAALILRDVQDNHATGP